MTGGNRRRGKGQKMARKERVNSFAVYVKGEGKRAARYTGETFSDPQAAIRAAAAHKDRSNAIMVKQMWRTSKSTGADKVFEIDSNNEIWFDSTFTAEFKAGKYKNN